MKNKTKKIYRLPKKFAEKWLKALRSGNYKQGTGGLITESDNHDGFKYCCLGVACAIEYSHKYLNNVNIWKAGLIPHLTVDLKKVPQEIKGSATNLLVDKLTDMNDNGRSFEEIADWIEENVEFYEK